MSDKILKYNTLQYYYNKENNRAAGQGEIKRMEWENDINNNNKIKIK